MDSLLEEEILDLTHPMYQTQPYPNEDEENKEEKKDFLESSIQLPEKSQDFPPPEKSILNRHRMKYTATRIKYYPPGLNRETFYRTLLPYWNKQG